MRATLNCALLSVTADINVSRGTNSLTNACQSRQVQAASDTSQNRNNNVGTRRPDTAKPHQHEQNRNQSLGRLGDNQNRAAGITIRDSPGKRAERRNRQQLSEPGQTNPRSTSAGEVHRQ